jgi:hypothetical protein
LHCTLHCGDATRCNKHRNLHCSNATSCNNTNAPAHADPETSKVFLINRTGTQPVLHHTPLDRYSKDCEAFYNVVAYYDIVDSV